MGDAPWSVAYVPKGPVLDWSKLELVDAALDAIEAHARRKGCIFVKIDPDVRERHDGRAPGAARAAAARLALQRRSDPVQEHRVLGPVGRRRGAAGNR